MKKIITLAAMAAAVLAGCTKQEVPAAVETDTQGAQYVTMNAGFANADTKLAFEADGTGYKTTWTTSDIVRLYYNNYKTEGSGALFTDEGDVVPDQTDQTKAQIKFKVTGISELAKAANVKWGAYVSNGHETAKETYGFWTDNYGTQDGTEASAQKFIFYYAGGTNLLTDLKSPVSFSCKNTMLKFTLTFPSGVTTGTASDITISGSNIYTTANYSWGGLYSGTTGNITISDQTITDGKITFYATVAPSKVSGVKVTAKVGDVTYTAVVETGEKTLSAGKVYNITRDFGRIVTIYEPHTACTYTFDTGLTPESGWPTNVTYNSADGVITFPTETAALNTNSLKFTDGSEVIAIRIGLDDFSGTYTLYSKAYNGLTNTTQEGTNKFKTTGLEFSKNTYSEKDGKTANFKVTGLYTNFELPAFVELSNDGSAPIVYFYLTNKEYQNGFACIPEQTSSSGGYGAWKDGTGKISYNLAETNFGKSDCNYVWLPLVADATTGTLKIKIGSTYPEVGSTYTDFPNITNTYCYGLAFVESGYDRGSFKTIYQFNYGNVERNSYFSK